MLARINRLAASPHKWSLLRASAGSLRGTPAHGGALDQHLEMTYRWLCAAQDATPDGGVAGFFDLWGGSWSASYPETTGYIIPSFLALAQTRSDEQAYDRALRMADWSCEVQMEEGAVLSGLVGSAPQPAVFNTGQAIFGWLSAYEASGRERYAESARRAAEWLCARQASDGAWRGSLSMLTSGPVHTYNGRCAWALAYAAKALGEHRFADAAQGATEWVLGQQNEVGWFRNNAFSAEEVPLLHTISYVIEGLLGTYGFLGDRRYLDGARRAVDPIARLARSGGLLGRLDERWRATVRWRCPTGEAQIATVLHRLERACPGSRYGEDARHLINELAGVQGALARRVAVEPSAHPAVGGLPGSWPLWGQYMRFALPNWAAKFFLDALMLETAGVDEMGFRAPVAGA
jgi:hypothetical protein